MPQCLHQKESQSYVAFLTGIFFAGSHDKKYLFKMFLFLSQKKKKIFYQKKDIFLAAIATILQILTQRFSPYRLWLFWYFFKERNITENNFRKRLSIFQIFHELFKRVSIFLLVQSILFKTRLSIRECKGFCWMPWRLFRINK